MTTWDSSNKSPRITLSGGDLVATTDGNSMGQVAVATAGKSSGKWYFEVSIADDGLGGSSNLAIGVTDSRQTVGTLAVAGSLVDIEANGSYGWVAFDPNGGASKLRHQSTDLQTGLAVIGTGSVIGVAFDATNGVLKFFKDGAQLGTDVSYSVGGTGVTYPAVGQAGTRNFILTANFGATAWAYTPPAGYAGFDEPLPGQASPSFSALTAAAYQAYGNASFSVMTAAAGGPVIGAGVFEPMTASSVYGAGTLEQMTAAAYQNYGQASFSAQTATAVGDQLDFAQATFEPMTASADGQGGAAATSDPTLTAFRPISASGAAENNNATGTPSFELMTAAGYGPSFAAAALEALEATGQAYAGTTAHGSPSMAEMSATASALSQGVSAGSARFATQRAEASGAYVPVASASAAFRALQGGAQGHADGVARGQALFRRATAQAGGYAVAQAVGVPTFAPMMGRGIGSAALADTVRTWVVNAGNAAVTEYTGYGFNSYAELGGTRYAAGPGGVYALEGADDDGSDIDWAFRTGMVDDKDPVLKRLYEVLMAARFDAPLRVRVWTDENTYFDYNIANFRPDVIHQVRAKLGRGTKSRYFRVEVSGVDNAHAEVASMQLPFVPTTRRIG